MSLAAAIVLDAEPQLSDGLRAVVPSTEQALDDAVGPAVGRRAHRAGRSPLIGSQGYGLVNEPNDGTVPASPSPITCR